MLWILLQYLHRLHLKALHRTETENSPVPSTQSLREVVLQKPNVQTWSLLIGSHWTQALICPVTLHSEYKLPKCCPTENNEAELQQGLIRGFTTLYHAISYVTIYVYKTVDYWPFIQQPFWGILTTSCPVLRIQRYSSWDLSLLVMAGYNYRNLE